MVGEKGEGAAFYKIPKIPGIEALLQTLLEQSAEGAVQAEELLQEAALVGLKVMVRKTGAADGKETTHG